MSDEQEEVRIVLLHYVRKHEDEMTVWRGMNSMRAGMVKRADASFSIFADGWDAEEKNAMRTAIDNKDHEYIDDNWPNFTGETEHFITYDQVLLGEVDSD